MRVTRSEFHEYRNVGNAGLAFDARGLRVPSLVESSSLADIRLDPRPVFRADDGDGAREYAGLASHLRYRMRDRDASVYVVDNHNYALDAWYEVAGWGIPAALIHIDQHSDLRPNDLVLPDPARVERAEWFRLVHEGTNVGNYIVPALRSGLVGPMFRLENETALCGFDPDAIPAETSVVLNVDLDFFAPEMEIADSDGALAIMRTLMGRSRLVTIATSPYFLDQEKAVELLRGLLDGFVAISE